MNLRNMVVHGERIWLRPLNESDITDRYLAWFRSSEITEFLEARQITMQSALDYLRNGPISGEYFMFAICDNKDDLHIGNLKIGPLQKRHGTSDLVTIIGDAAYWGKGLATEAIVLGNKIAFQYLEIRKLSGGIYSENVASIKCYTKAGWVIEGRLLAHLVADNRIQDKVLVSCFNPAFFEIEIESSEKYRIKSK